MLIISLFVSAATGMRPPIFVVIVAGHIAAADAFAPSRATRWQNPKGGFIHALHRAHWGGFHYRITGKDAEHKVAYEGGWQNRQSIYRARAERIYQALLSAGIETFLSPEEYS